MAISFVATGTRSIVDNAATTPSIPAGTTDNDLMLLFDANTGSVVTSAPSGWTALFEISNSNFHMHVMYRRFVSGDSGPTVDFSSAAGDVHYSVIGSYRGVVNTGDPTDVLGATSTNASANDIGPVTGITTTENDAAIIVFALKGNDSGTIATLTGDGLTWARFDFIDDTVIGDDCTFVADYALIPTALTVTDKTFDDDATSAGTQGIGLSRMLSLVTEGVGGGASPVASLGSWTS